MVYMVGMTFLSSENKTQKCLFLIFFGNIAYNSEEGVVVALYILYNHKSTNENNAKNNNTFLKHFHQLLRTRIN